MICFNNPIASWSVYGSWRTRFVYWQLLQPSLWLTHALLVHSYFSPDVMVTIFVPPNKRIWAFREFNAIFIENYYNYFFFLFLTQNWINLVLLLLSLWLTVFILWNFCEIYKILLLGHFRELIGVSYSENAYSDGKVMYLLCYPIFRMQGLYSWWC